MKKLKEMDMLEANKVVMDPELRIMEDLVSRPEYPENKGALVPLTPVKIGEVISTASNGPLSQEMVIVDFEQ